MITWTKEVLTTRSGEYDPAQWAKKLIAWEKIQSIKSPKPPNVLLGLRRLELLRDLSFNFDVACAKACEAIEKSTKGLSKKEILTEINIDEKYWDSVRRSLLKDYDVVIKGTGKWTRYLMNATL